MAHFAFVGSLSRVGPHMGGDGGGLGETAVAHRAPDDGEG